MDKKTIYTLLPYIILALIATVFLTVKINSCNAPETVRLTRDSTEQKTIDSLREIRKEVQRLQQIVDSSLMNTQNGMEANKLYFKKLMNDFVISQNKKRKLPFNEQWEIYLKELDNE